MPAAKLGALLRGTKEDLPKWSWGERLALLLAAAAVIYALVYGGTELHRQGQARAALAEVKAAHLACRAVSAQCYATGRPFADQTSPDGFADGVAEEIQELGSLPGNVTLVQIDADGYTVRQLLYREGDFCALYSAQDGYTVWRAESRLDYRPAGGN